MMQQSLARLCWALGVVAAPGLLVAQTDTHAVTGDVATATLDGPTVFDSRPAPAATPSTTGAAMADPGRGHHAPVRLGEHYAAPFLDRDGGPRDAGLIITSSELTALELDTPRSPYQLREDIYIKLPKGANGDVGQRFLTYRLGPSYERYGQIVIPTGIVMVTRAAAAHEATTVRIMQQFANMEGGQYVLPLDDPTLPAPGTLPAPVDGGARSKVVYVDDEVVIPTISYYVVVPAKPADGYRIGDQITLIRPPDKDYDTRLTLPEVRIAIAQIVRVTPRSATAIVLAQEQPAIRPGVVTRLSAKMP
jgi:hypothetical protein